MLILYKLEEGNHIGPTKMVNSLETGEHATVGDALKVVLANILPEKKTVSVTSAKRLRKSTHQHGGP